MTLQQIYYVITIAKAGSFNKAAEQLFMAQPTLTSAVRDLETELDIRIFDRTRRGTALTEEGRDFINRSEQLYEQYEMLYGHYQEKAAKKHTFSVSAQHYSFVTKAFVETVLKYDASSYEFSVKHTRTKEVIEDVAEAKSEIGVIFLSEQNGRVISKMLKSRGLEFHKMLECRACVYLHRDHPLAQKKAISMNELHDYVCLVFDQGEENTAFFSEEILDDTEHMRVIRTNDKAAMLSLLARLDSFTIYSGIISDELDGPEYIAIPFEKDEKNSRFAMTIGYILRSHTHLSDIGELFLTELKKALKL